MTRASIRIAPRLSLAAAIVLLAWLSSCGTREQFPQEPVTAQEWNQAAELDASSALPRRTRPVFDLRDSQEVIEAYRASMIARDSWLYARLLAPEFEYFPRDRDIVDLPWMVGYSWPLADELLMIENMFDPSYSGGEPAVESIQAFMEIISTEEIEPGRLRITVHLEGAVITGIDGWVIDSRLVFELIETSENWAIERITELDPVGAVGGARTEDTSWALVKALYRSEY